MRLVDRLRCPHGIEVPVDVCGNGRRSALQPRTSRGHERSERLHEVSDDSVERFSGFVAVKGKLEPGRLRGAALGLS